MNKANKITICRIILSIIIVIFLLFPFHEIGYDFSTYLLKGRIVIDLKYIIIGILFIIATIADYFDGYIAKKNNIVTDFGRMIDTISDKLLIDSTLIILACEGKINTIVAVVIVIIDVVVDVIKLTMANKGHIIETKSFVRIKEMTLILGIVLTLFYNLPFELIPLRISDFLLAVSAILSMIICSKYYMMAKPYLNQK